MDDKQALREELIKIIDTYGYDELPTAEHTADAIIKVIDAYTEQRVREARIDALERILGHWHHGSHPDAQTVMKLAEQDLATLTNKKGV